MIKIGEEPTKSFIKKINQEMKIKEPYFYDVHRLSRKYKKGSVTSNEEIIKEIRKKGHKAELTHFKTEGIRSTIGIRELAAILKSF